MKSDGAAITELAFDFQGKNIHIPRKLLVKSFDGTFV